MHGGKPWLGEGFPPESAERDAVLGIDARTPVCTCPTRDTPWMKEGHAPDCPACVSGFGKSVVGGAGDPVSCTCSPEWKGEGHDKGCAKRATGQACTCRTLKFDGEGHHPDCVARQTPEPVKAKKAR